MMSNGFAVRRRAAALLLAGTMIAVAACGNRLPEDEIVAAAGGTATAADGFDTPAAATSGGETVAEDPTAGGAAPVAGGTATPSTVAGGGGGSDAQGPAAGGTGGAGASPQPGPANLSPIRIGNIGEYSGVVGSSFGSASKMVPVVVKWINDNGGLNGHPIELVQGDNASDPSKYQTIAQRMVEQDGVVAFMGNLVPISGPGADAYLTSKGIPIIGGDGAHRLWQSNPNMFFTGPGLEKLVLAGARYAHDRLEHNKFAVFYCGEAADACGAFQRAMASSAATAAGIDTVYQAQTSLFQPDFTAECLNAKNAGATAVVLGMDANALTRAVRSCVAQGYNPQFVGASVEVVNSLAQVPEFEGFIAPEPMAPWVSSDTPATRAYHDAVQRYAPGLELSAATSAMWVSGMLLRAASANLPSGKVTPDDFKKGLYALRDESLGGLVPNTTFTPGKPSPNPDCYYIVQVKAKQWIAPQGSTLQC